MVLVLDKENLRQDNGGRTRPTEGQRGTDGIFFALYRAMWPMDLVRAFMARAEVEGREMTVICSHYDPMEVEGYVMLNN